MNSLLCKLFPRLLLPAAFLLFNASLFAQIQKRLPDRAIVRYNNNRHFTDTLPVKRVIISRQVIINPELVSSLHKVPAADTVLSLDPYLQSKAGCDFEKAIDTDGCVIIKYTDGLIKKVCDGTVTEIIMPDGKKYVSRWGRIVSLMYVTKLPPPPNPTEEDSSYSWLNNYNDELLADIKKYLGNDAQLVKQYLREEKTGCEQNLYKQIEYRTIFLEEFLSAK